MKAKLLASVAIGSDTLDLFLCDDGQVLVSTEQSGVQNDQKVTPGQTVVIWYANPDGDFTLDFTKFVPPQHTKTVADPPVTILTKEPFAYAGGGVVGKMVAAAPNMQQMAKDGVFSGMKKTFATHGKSEVAVQFTTGAPEPVGSMIALQNGESPGLYKVTGITELGNGDFSVHAVRVFKALKSMGSEGWVSAEPADLIAAWPVAYGLLLDKGCVVRSYKYESGSIFEIALAGVVIAQYDTGSDLGADNPNIGEWLCQTCALLNAGNVTATGNEDWADSFAYMVKASDALKGLAKAANKAAAAAGALPIKVEQAPKGMPALPKISVQGYKFDDPLKDALLDRLNALGFGVLQTGKHEWLVTNCEPTEWDKTHETEGKHDTPFFAMLNALKSTSAWSHLDTKAPDDATINANWITWVDSGSSWVCTEDLEAAFENVQVKHGLWFGHTKTPNVGIGAQQAVAATSDFSKVWMGPPCGATEAIHVWLGQIDAELSEGTTTPLTKEEYLFPSSKALCKLQDDLWEKHGVKVFKDGKGWAAGMPAKIGVGIIGAAAPPVAAGTNVPKYCLDWLTDLKHGLDHNAPPQQKDPSSLVSFGGVKVPEWVNRLALWMNDHAVPVKFEYDHEYQSYLMKAGKTPATSYGYTLSKQEAVDLTPGLVASMCLWAMDAVEAHTGKKPEAPTLFPEDLLPIIPDEEDDPHYDPEWSLDDEEDDPVNEPTGLFSGPPNDTPEGTPIPLIKGEFVTSKGMAAKIAGTSPWATAAKSLHSGPPAMDLVGVDPGSTVGSFAGISIIGSAALSDMSAVASVGLDDVIQKAIDKGIEAQVEKQIAKALNFADAYGAGPTTMTKLGAGLVASGVAQMMAPGHPATKNLDPDMDGPSMGFNVHGTHQFEVEGPPPTWFVSFAAKVVNKVSGMLGQTLGNAQVYGPTALDPNMAISVSAAKGGDTAVTLRPNDLKAKCAQHVFVDLIARLLVGHLHGLFFANPTMAPPGGKWQQKIDLTMHLTTDSGKLLKQVTKYQHAGLIYVPLNLYTPALWDDDKPEGWLAYMLPMQQKLEPQGETVWRLVYLHPAVLKDEKGWLNLVNGEPPIFVGGQDVPSGVVQGEGPWFDFVSGSYWSENKDGTYSCT